MAIGAVEPSCGAACLPAGATERVAGGAASAGVEAVASEVPSGRMVMVRTRLGSLALAGGAAVVKGAADCTDWRGAVIDGVATGSAIGCSSRGMTRSGAESAAMRSWNGLPWASTFAAAACGGTVLAGVGSALITGGGPLEIEPDVKAR